MAKAPFKKEQVNFEAFGANVKTFRKQREMTRMELAKMAGVSRRTLYNVEQGTPVHLESIRKICLGLNIHYEDMVFGERYKNVHNPSSESFVLHTTDKLIWHTQMDRRKVVPENNFSLIQDPEERHRIGRLGLVGGFMSGFSFVMEKGPGILLFEVYKKFELPRVLHYRNAVYFVQRGAVKLKIGDQEQKLEEGDAVGAASSTIVVVEPLEKNPELPPILQFIAADRVSRKGMVPDE